MALVGLAAFYGLDRLAITSRLSKREGGKEGSTSPGVFWLHIFSFAVYNFLIGYLLLHRIDTGPGNLLLFFVAMALHFVVNDHGLREHHKGAYLSAGRWVLAAAVVLGWVVGLLAEIPEVAIAVLTAFLAGGVIIRLEGGASRGASEPLLGLRSRGRTVHDGAAGTVRADGGHPLGPPRRETCLGEAVDGRGYGPQLQEGASRGGGVRWRRGHGDRFAQRFPVVGAYPSL